MTSGSAVFLETARLRLRDITPDDLDRLTELYSDPEVMRYITGGAAVPRAEIAAEVLPRFTRHRSATNARAYWAAELRPTGEFLGWFGLMPLCDREVFTLELGYRLHRTAWRQGYATEGSLALIAKGFTEYGAEQIIAQTMTVNRASRRVMEKCGLSFYRTFQGDWRDVIPGSEEGDVEYVLRRADWRPVRS